MDKTWKADERLIAKYLGGMRVPVTGRARGSAPDVDHDKLSIECKRVKDFPKWITDAHAQAVAAQLQSQIKDGKERLPIVVIKPHRTNIERCYVVMQLGDFKMWVSRGTGES